MVPDTSVFFPPTDHGDAQPDARPVAARKVLESLGEGLEALQADLAVQTRMVDKLKQAMARLRAGDEARARKVIAKVVANPWDEREQTWPGWRAAMSLLHDTVIDDLQAAPVGDDRWLRACEQAFAATNDPLGRAVLVQTLAIAAQDYRLEAAEEERCLAVTGGEPPRVDSDLAPTAADDLPDAVVTLLRVVIAYRDAKAALRSSG